SQLRTPAEPTTWGFNLNSKLADHGLDSGTDRLLTEAPRQKWEATTMTIKLLLALFLLFLTAVFGAPLGYYVFYQKSLSPEAYQDRRPSGSVHGAPGPIAGAGLPVLAVGYGVYWLVRRRKKAQ